MLEIINDHNGCGSLLMISQVPIERWHEIIVDPTLSPDRLRRRPAPVRVPCQRRRAYRLESAQPRIVDTQSKTDAEAEGARIGIPRGKGGNCAVRALRAWLGAVGNDRGPVFRAITGRRTVRATALSGQAVRMILLKRARLAGIKGIRLEPISPHGLRAGFRDVAYRNQVAEEEIIGHSRHRSLTKMRSYVRRSKLSHASPAGKVGL